MSSYPKWNIFAFNHNFVRKLDKVGLGWSARVCHKMNANNNRIWRNAVFISTLLKIVSLANFHNKKTEILYLDYYHHGTTQAASKLWNGRRSWSPERVLNSFQNLNSLYKNINIHALQVAFLSAIDCISLLAKK